LVLETYVEHCWSHFLLLLLLLLLQARALWLIGACGTKLEQWIGA
jgi:hypothetical protein